MGFFGNTKRVTWIARFRLPVDGCLSPFLLRTLVKMELVANDGFLFFDVHYERGPLVVPPMDIQMS